MSINNQLNCFISKLPVPKPVILCIDVIRIILDYLSDLTETESVWRYYIDSKERMRTCLNWNNSWVGQLSSLISYKSNNLPFTHPLVLRFAYDNTRWAGLATTVVLSNWPCSTTLGPMVDSFERTYTSIMCNFDNMDFEDAYDSDGLVYAIGTCSNETTYIYMDFSKSIYDIDYLNVTSRGTIYGGSGPYAINSGENIDDESDDLWFKPNVESLLWICPMPNAEYSVMPYIDTERMSTWSDLEQRWVVLH
jgi:hypothetical protein